MAQRAPVSPSVARAWDDPTRLLDVDHARDQILAAFAPLPAVELSIGDALGLVLAEDIVASANVPPFANSAMDGFAVRAADTEGARPDHPISLRVLGEAAAGHVAAITVEPGTAVRIMTGAPVPLGADAVVRFEETDELPERDLGPRDALTIGIWRAAKPGEHIRPAGEDVRAGERVLAAGIRLRPAEIALLAALGQARVRVHRRPRVAVLTTGDEVVEPGQQLQSGQIWNCNGPMIAAMVRHRGGEVIPLGNARDSTAALREKLCAAQAADLLLTTGGVSTGDYDLVKTVLCQEGEFALWQVRLKPGKPLAFGQIGGVPLLGLPGNPVAAAIAFEQFARPVIWKLLGRTNLTLPTVPARLRDRVDNRGGRRHFVRVHVEATPTGYVASLAGAPGAGILTSLVQANGLLVVPEECASAEPGTLLPVQMLDWDLG